MFDERDLDHRLYGWKTPIEAEHMPLYELIETSRRVGNSERNTAIDERLEKWIGKLKEITVRNMGLAGTARG